MITPDSEAILDSDAYQAHVTREWWQIRGSSCTDNFQVSPIRAQPVCTSAHHCVSTEDQPVTGYVRPDSDKARTARRVDCSCR